MKDSNLFICLFPFCPLQQGMECTCRKNKWVSDITTHPTSPPHVPELPEILSFLNYLHTDHPLILFKNNFLNSDILGNHKIFFFNVPKSCANLTAIRIATGQIKHLIWNSCWEHSAKMENERITFFNWLFS